MTIRKATYSEIQKILNHSLDVLKEATMGFVEVRREIAFQRISPFLSDGGYKQGEGSCVWLHKNPLLVTFPVVEN